MARLLNCNLCGSDEFVVLFAAGRAQSNRVVRCAKCDLMYANPRSSELDHVKVGRHDPEYLPGMLRRERDPRMDKERLQVRDCAGTRRLLAQRFPQRGTMLEIGCGLGFLLDYYRGDGWQVRGLDPDPLMARHARDVLGVDVRTATLDESDFAEASFDVVLMMHVIEHLADPAATLARVQRLLRPGGMLVIETPRLDSLAFKLLGARERNMACEGHVYFFTTRTLAALTGKVGFVQVRCDLVGRSMTLDRLLWHTGTIARAPALQSALDRVSRALRLDKVPLSLNLRDIQRLVLQRPG